MSPLYGAGAFPQAKLTSDQDKGIGDQRGRRQGGQVSEQAQGQNNQQLSGDEVFDRDMLLALGYSKNEGLQVLGNEDGVG
jgi:hypothetical protein